VTEHAACALFTPDRAGRAAAARRAVTLGALLRGGLARVPGPPSLESPMSHTPGRPERRIWRDTRVDADDEIAFHLEMRARDFRERGMSEAEARAEARRRFGSIDTITTQVRQIDEESARQKRRTGMW